MRRLVVAVLFLAAAVAAGVVSCTQGEGGRCQIKTDCDEGLVCNQATGTCQSSTSGADGEITPDARVDGGPTYDAGPDAEVPDGDLPDAD